MAQRGERCASSEATLKVVGRRDAGAGDWEDVDRLQRTMIELRGSAALVPGGVYRFDSFEEADEWMIRTIARTHGRRRSRISPASVTR